MHFFAFFVEIATARRIDDCHFTWNYQDVKNIFPISIFFYFPADYYDEKINPAHCGYPHTRT